MIRAVVALVVLSCSFLACGRVLTVAERGGSGFAIGVPARPTPAQITAANELRHYLNLVTGCALEIVEGEEPTKGVVLLPGDGTLGEDGYRLVAQPTRLAIFADGIHGHLFGAYGFLEDYAGVEWFASDCTNVPVRASVSVPAGLDRTERPAFELRDMGEYDVTRHVEFAAHLRLHGRHFSFPEKLGGDAFRMDRVLGNSHTFQRMFPVGKFYKDHPEWFSMVDGKRVDLCPQLCLTNPEMTAKAIEFVIARIRANPEVKYYGVSQNDWHNRCECPSCKALEDAEESPAGPVIAFVNKIAEAVEKVDPKVTITTLAYQWSRKPPKSIRPRRNVVVVLCDIECDMSKPLEMSRAEANAKFMEYLRGWGRLTGRIYLWDYFVNYPFYPHKFNDIDAVAANLRTFLANGVTQVYEEGNNQGPHSDSAPLKAWLFAHLLWNPHADVDALVDRFVTGYYGKGAPFVREYYSEYRREASLRDESKSPMRCFEKICETPTPVKFYDRGAELWTKALEAVAGDPRRERACRWGRFSCDFSRTVLYSLSLEGARVALTRHPERLGGPDADIARAAALRCLPLLDEEPRIRLAISRGEVLEAAIRQVATREWPPKDATRAILDTKTLRVASSPERYTIVESAETESGLAVSINTKRDCSGIQFDFRDAYVDPDTPVSLRVRLKIVPKADGKPGRIVFKAQVDAPGTDRKHHYFSIKAKDAVPGQWKWYHLGTVPYVDAKSRFWCGLSGTADDPVAESVVFDSLELSLAGRDAVCEDARIRETVRSENQ